MTERIPLGTFGLPEGHRFKLSAEVREEPGRATLVVALFAAPADSTAEAELDEEERARYSIWLAKIGDRPFVAVDHAQGMSSVASADGEPYLYWHGKAPGTRPFS